MITGSDSGIGFETAKNCVENGAKVILACVEDQVATKAAAFLNSIRKDSAEFMKIDLSDSESIYQFVKVFKDKYQKLDILVNNAGVMGIPKRSLTKEGFEMTLGVNYFGHFLLTNLLKDSLKASQQFRVINIASIAHLGGVLDLGDLHFSKRSYNSMMAYCQSKIAILLFTKKFSKIIEDEKMNGVCVSLHPGIVRTNLYRNITGVSKFLFQLIAPIFDFVYNTPFDGAQTSLYCIHEDFEKLQQGAYYIDCKKSNQLSKQITDSNADMLWNISLKAFQL